MREIMHRSDSITHTHTIIFTQKTSINEDIYIYIYIYICLKTCTNTTIHRLIYINRKECTHFAKPHAFKTILVTQGVTTSWSGICSHDDGLYVNAQVLVEGFSWGEPLDGTGLVVFSWQN